MIGLGLALLWLAAAAAQAIADVTPARFITGSFIGSGATYTVAPDGTVWYTNTSGVAHYDQNGNDLHDGFTVTASGYHPLGVALYGGRLYVVTSGSSNHNLYSYTAGAGPANNGGVFNDFYTSSRLGSTGGTIRALGSTGFITTGLNNSVVTADLTNLNTTNPFYSQAVMGWGVNDPSPPGNGFESCQTSGPGSACYSVSGMSGQSLGHLNDTVDVAAGPSGSVYVLEGIVPMDNKPRITHLTPSPMNGSLLPDFGFENSVGSAQGQLNSPLSIVYDPTSGHLFVADNGNNRIVEFDASGNFLRAFGWGVKDGANQFEVCGPQVGSTCQAGISRTNTDYRLLHIDAAGELYAGTPAGIQVFSLGEQTPTSTSTSCTPPSVPAFGSVTCTATVANAGSGGSTPTGMVNFKPSGPAVYGGSGSCALAGAGSSASCHTTFTPTVIGIGSHVVSITGSYSGDGKHNPSAGTTTVTVAGTPPYPTLTNLTFATQTFHAAGSGPSATSAAKKVPIGTTVSFKLSNAGTIRFTVSRSGPGRKIKSGHKHKCVKPNKGNHSKPHCKLQITLKGSFTINGVAGANKFHFTGRLNGKKLPPGKYILTATPIAGSSTGPATSANFRIVR